MPDSGAAGAHLTVFVVVAGVYGTQSSVVISASSAGCPFVRC